MNQIDQDYKNFIVEIIREFDYECAPRQLKIYEKLVGNLYQNSKIRSAILWLEFLKLEILS